MLHERHLGEASNYSEYVASLPKVFDLPLVWTNEELGELNGTQLLTKVIQQRRAVEVEYQELVLPVLQRLSHASHLGEDFPTDLAAYLWAQCCVLSRAFLVHTEDAKLPVLIPGVDLFNAGPVDTHLDIDQATGVVRVVSTQE